jgi:hypothetical protein
MTAAKVQEVLPADAVQADLEQRARMPGGISRHRALQNARSELNRLKPHLSTYITDECTNLEVALSAAGIPGPHQEASIRAAQVASQRLHDVAEPMGFILVALIAKNLCEVFEVASDVKIAYPRAVLDCHFDALRLIQQRRYRDLRPQDLPELTSGLARAVQVVKKLAAAASSAPAENMPSEP